ncbi:MAG TPA: TIR domain-containing protein [Blastocatellia bacterium]|nr:TIR domain-containing protein [Blastocatellia bacterium]
MTELTNHTGQVCGLSWSPDGSRLCSASMDGEVRLWSVDDLSYAVLNPRAGFDSIGSHDQTKHMAFSAAWSSHDDLIAVSFGGHFRVWKAGTGELIEETESPPRLHLSWSPAASILAMTRIDSLAGGNPQYKVEVGRVQPLEILAGLTETFPEIDDVAWSPDGEMIATATGSGVALSRKSSSEPTGSISVQPRANSVVWLSDRTVAAGCIDANIRIYSWRYEDRWPQGIMAERVRVLEGHESYIHQLSYSPEQSLLASLDDSGEIHLWRGDSLSHVTALAGLIEREGVVRSLRLALHPRQPIVAISCAGRIRLARVRLPDSGNGPSAPDGAGRPESEPLPRVLAMAGLLPEQKPDSDQIAERWGPEAQTDSRFESAPRPYASEVLARTLALRRVAQLVSEFDSLAGEGMQLAWRSPEPSEEIEIEKLELAAYQDDGEARASSRRGLSRLLLRTAADGVTEQKRLPALVAYVAMAHGSREEVREAFGEASEFWRQADRLDKALRRLARRIQALYPAGGYEKLAENMAAVLAELQGAMVRAKQLQNDLKQMREETGAMSAATTRPVEIFYSYSHLDEKFREELVKHLRLLERQGVITGWHDRNISAGIEWKDSIDEHLESAGIILLLVSANFLASDYCYDVEMKRAIKRHDEGSARVIPIILSSCRWHSAPFGKLQALPRDSRPIENWDRPAEAYTNVVEGIEKAIVEISKVP